MRLTCLGLLLALAAPAAFAAPSADDRSFLAYEAQGSAYELAIAQRAVQDATRGDVKAHARGVVSDHEQASAALQRLAQDEGVALPTGMTNDEQSRFAGL